MVALSAIRQPVEKELEEYRKLFCQTLTHTDDYLGEALKHIQQRQGKMMRPLLVLLMAREFGRVSLTALRSAVSLELLHTASLVHDDVVDDSGERRGIPSTSAVFGNKVAILLGDYLLSKSLEQTALTDNIRMVEIIARLGGILSEGEMKQLENIRNTDLTETNYFSIIHHKTASLFEACARLGAISGNASEEMENICARFGEIVGICFQLRDDIFDYFDDAAIGKPTGNDMTEGKLTLPALYAVAHTKRNDVKVWAAHVKALTATREEISALVEYTKEAGGIEYAQRKMEAYRQQALPLLDQLKNAEVRTALENYLNFTIGREN